jgi:hypothetical protein
MQRNIWSGIKLHWPLADALAWRLQWQCSLNEAFGELAQICLEGRVQAIGVSIGSHPERPSDWDFPSYLPFVDPPSAIPVGTPGLGLIPADHWSDFCPVLDHDQHPTSGLDYASVRLPAWRNVEFDRDALVLVWRPKIQKQANTADVDAHSKPRLDIPKKVLMEHLDAIKQKGGPIPAADSLLPGIANTYNQYHVTREDVRAVHKEVFGDLRRGRRPKQIS